MLRSGLHDFDGANLVGACVKAKFGQCFVGTYFVRNHLIPSRCKIIGGRRYHEKLGDHVVILGQLPRCAVA